MITPEALKKWLEKSSPRQKLFAGLLAFSILATGALFLLSENPNRNDPLASTPFFIFDVFVKLIGVLLLIVVVAVVYRRWGNPVLGSSVKRNLTLIETLRLSPKQAIHLVEIGGEQILLGATDQSISLLKSIPLDAEKRDIPEKNFASVLETVSLHPEFSTVDEKETGNEH
jgi:flagellar protein FliO/FliZ